MMSLKKFLIVGLAVFMVVAGTITILVDVFFPPERLKAFVLGEMEKKLARQVSIEEVGFSIWGGLGVEVRDVTIGERAAFQAQGAFITLDQFLLHVQFWPLLNRELVVDELIIEQPNISIFYDETGEANFADLMGTAPPVENADSSDTSTEAPFAVQLSAIRLNNGVIRYTDVRNNEQIELRNINNEVALTIERNANIRADGVLAIEEIDMKGPDGHIELGLQLAYRTAIDPNIQTVMIESLALSLGEIGINLTGQISDYDAVAPHVDLTVASSDISIENLIASLPDKIRSDLGGVSGAGQIAITGRILGAIGPGSLPEVNAHIALKDGRFETPDLPVPVTQIGSDIDLDLREVKINNLTAHLGQSDLSIRGSARGLIGSGGPKPAIRLSVKSDFLNLDEIYIPEEEAAPFLPLPDILVSGDATVNRLLVSGLNLQNARVSFAMQDQIVQLTDISVDAYGGRLVGALTHDQTNIRNPKVTMDIGIEKVRVGEILSPILPVKDILTGTITTKFAGVSSLDSVGNPLLNALTALGSLTIESGQLSNWPPLQQLATWLKIPDVATINIKNLVGGFQIDNGRVASNRIQMIGQNTEWIAVGSTGLDGTLDYGIQLVFSEDLAAKLGDKLSAQALSLFKDDKGRPGVHFRVGGTVASPAFKWDSGALKKQVKDKVAEEASRLVADQKQKLLGDTPLANVTVDTLKQQASVVADSIKTEISGAKDKAKATLKGLLKRN